MRSQMRNAHPRQDQKALLVSDACQELDPLLYRPTDEPVSLGHFPGRRPKYHDGQLPTVSISGQVLHVLSDRSVKASVMKLGQPLLHLLTLGPGVGQFQADRSQPVERNLDELSAQIQQGLKDERRSLRRGATRAPAGRRQVNQPAPGQLEQQRPSGHVLDLAGGVAPVPKLAQMKRKGRAMPIGMLRDQRPQLP